MESANIHHHQLHQLQDGSSALVIPSCYAAGTTHAWTPNTILGSSSSLNACSNVTTLSPRDALQQNNMMLSSPLDCSITQDHSGFNWVQPGQDLHLPRLKNDTSDSSSYMKNEGSDLKDLNEKLVPRNFHSGYQLNGFQLSSEDSNSSLSSNGSVNFPNRGSFSHIFPNMNNLDINQMSLANASNLDMNFQALDLLNSARFNEAFGQISMDHHQHGFPKNGFFYGLDHMQLQSLRPSTSPNNMSNFSNGVAEAKRSPSIMLEPKAPPQPAPKKPRIESRASCPPFNVMKVRKEKLGDRIAALQQMVAPFGKTDTASVLMEAIGYIKFLQNQVETLSVPYMKRNKTRIVQGGASRNENDEPKRDLRSQGLCLVPVSCLSYVADGGGGVWPPPPPNFGGGI